MPHAHKLVQCVAIENTLKILKNTHAPLNLCTNIANTIKMLKNTHAPHPQPCTVCRY